MTTPQKCLSGTGKDKSSFAMTCNRLSLLMKEKGSSTLRDIRINATFDLTENPEMSTNVNVNTTLTTVDLLSNMRSAVQSTEKSVINHLPRFVSSDSFCKPDDSPDRSVSGEMATTTGCKTSQMTILYNGQILVFDHVSADKAREMMFVANGSSPSPSSSDDDDDNQIQNRIPLASTSDSVSEMFGLREENESDLPIVRRSSLHKFLSKRKERARSVRRGPYRLNHRVMADPSFNRDFDLNF